MCFYERDDYSCDDWKWKNLKERCPRQDRLGERCGATLTHPDHITKLPHQCQICKKIAVKTRRHQWLRKKIDCWLREADKFPASLEKARSEKEKVE